MLLSRHCKGAEKPVNGRERIADLPLYPVDMAAFLALPHCTFDTVGVPYHRQPEEYHPVTIARYALAHWNLYCATDDVKHRETFLVQARWLFEHAAVLGEGTCACPIASPGSMVLGLWLSASAQGCGISVMVRAYQLTRERAFLETARRVARIFERDILDSGVQVPVGVSGVFFEEVALYPARYQLGGFLFALLGLYDYVALEKDSELEQLIERGLTALHTLLPEFDLGYWTRSELFQRGPSSHFTHVLQGMLLKALARRSGCKHCLALASRWESYSRRVITRWRYKMVSHASFTHVYWKSVQNVLFPQKQNTQGTRVCIPITGFPVTGGTRSVLKGVSQVTQGLWQIEYLTQHLGTDPGIFVVRQFGTRRMEPWQFPFVWLYFLAGCWRLLALLRQETGYQLILPQDGVFTAAFAALAAKLAGVRVVCMDHGNLTLLKSHTYRSERARALASKNWSGPRRLFARFRLACYWPSLELLARISARYVDHFLIPGVAGDGVEDACQRLGVPASRITRFASMVDVDEYARPDAVTRVRMRQEEGLANDTIVIAMVCRLAPEKGLDIALEGIHRALTRLSHDLRERVRVLVAGDGPLREQVVEEIARRGLEQIIWLRGETSARGVGALLAMSDIFLYTSTRGACLPMALLEAMASSCAVIATPLPLANVSLLADERGVIVPAGDGEQTALALATLIGDRERCQRMGKLARDYVEIWHSAAAFKRTLLRATGWSELDLTTRAKEQEE